MTKPHWIDEHVKEITKYQRLLDQVPDEDKVTQIDLLSKQLVFIGKLAAEFAEEHKRIYNERKRVYAQAEIDAPRKAQAYAELAVVDLRDQEKEAFGNMKRWGNAFTSTRERLNALKYKLKIDIEDGSSKGRF
ncbi:hypothetical protein SAMN05877753_1234 [Bacillus oleivorans]|uniref:Uncharacterized protein n=1 Tax=Bacillus oleivorans TaxID=1448271 RepID=A0A285D803_9BACI|nr:hypothetical protein [Bacillus oleivorans]SNX75947.1 hypothetical protein SAMN05877753_1234 [Bacillus oleivorans]